MEIRTKQFALVPAVSKEICFHNNVQWSGKIPCTGYLFCPMCGMRFDSLYDRVLAIHFAKRVDWMYQQQIKAGSPFFLGGA